MAGAVTGLAGPDAGLAAEAAATGAGGVVGGIVERANNGEGSTAGQIGKDAVVGALAGSLGKAADSSVATKAVGIVTKRVTDGGTEVINKVIDGAGSAAGAGSHQRQKPVVVSTPNGSSCGGRDMGACTGGN